LIRRIDQGCILFVPRNKLVAILRTAVTDLVQAAGLLFDIALLRHGGLKRESRELAVCLTAEARRTRRRNFFASHRRGAESAEKRIFCFPFGKSFLIFSLRPLRLRGKTRVVALCKDGYAFSSRLNGWESRFPANIYFTRKMLS